MAFFKQTQTSADGRQIKISYSILGIGLLILTLTITVIALMDFWLSWDIVLREYISMSAFGCVTIGLIYNATSLQHNYELNKQRIEKEDKESHGKKVKITYEAISEWYKVDMAMNAEIARRFMQPFKGRLDNPKSLRKFKQQLNAKENTSVRKSLISVLNYFEHLSLLSCDSVINEDILKKAFRTAFVTYYTNLKGYIEDEQRGNSGGNSKIYINFVQMARKWLNN